MDPPVNEFKCSADHDAGGDNHEIRRRFSLAFESVEGYLHLRVPLLVGNDPGESR